MTIRLPSVAARLAATPKHETPRERKADRFVLLAGVAFALLACVILLAFAAWRGEALASVSLSLYGIGMASSLLFSALYNLSESSRFSEWLRRLDHAAIFVMIAGTYTPFALLKVGGPFGPGFVAGLWMVAAAGVAMKLFLPRKFEGLSILLYLGLGWSFLLGLDAVVAALPLFPTLGLLFAGGLFYTVGVPIFLSARTIPFRLAIWHGFVLLATILHFFAVISILL